MQLLPKCIVARILRNFWCEYVLFVLHLLQINVQQQAGMLGNVVEDAAGNEHIPNFIQSR